MGKPTGFIEYLYELPFQCPLSDRYEIKLGY
jgi:hypothetical protein